MKKAISILLTVMLIFTAIPMGAFIVNADSTYYTEGYYTYQVENGKATIISVDYSAIKGDVVIPDTLGGYKVAAIDEGVFRWNGNITGITVPSSVETIGSEAFRGCSNLKNLSISSGVKSLGFSVASGCTNLTNITLPDTIAMIPVNAFYNCTSLTSIVIPDGVSVIGDYAFSCCESLTNITLPDSLMVIARQAFYCCKKLSDIVIPNSVTKIGYYAFVDCNSLTTVTIPDGVTSIDTSFIANDKLSEINVSNDNSAYCSIDGVLFNKDVTELVMYPMAKSETTYTIPESVKVIDERAFYGATKLVNITIPNGVTSIGDWAFYYCTGISSFSLPESISNIGEYAFRYCTAITDFALPNNVTSVRYGTFYDCTALAKVNMSENIVEIYDEVFYNTSLYNDSSNWQDGVLYIDNYLIKANDTVSGQYVVNEQTKAIAYEAFYDNNAITSIVLPDSIVSIGDAAFGGCSSLESINIPKGVESIGDAAFGGCSSLESINIPDGIERVGENVFYECNSLTSINIPNGVTSIGGWAFYGCDNLTEIILPDSITSIGENAFSYTAYYNNKNNWNNNALYINNHLIKIDENNVVGEYVVEDGTKTIAGGAIPYSEQLTDILVPDSVINMNFHYNYSIYPNINVSKDNPNYCSIDGVLFNKDATTLIKYPDIRDVEKYIVPESVVKIGEGAFFCSSVKNIILNEGVEIIEDYSFEGCGIKSIRLPKSVKYIGEYSFIGFLESLELEDIWYSGSVEDMASIDVNTDTNLGLLEAVWHYNSCINSEEHEYDNACDAICNTCKCTRDVSPHVYDDATDDECNICGAKKGGESGDINGDANINNKDLGLLMQYLNGWNVEISVDAADVNRDGSVNNKDYGLLMQYLNGWDVQLK